MTATDKSAEVPTESLSFDFDLHHAPEKVWRALTDPVLLKEWLLPTVSLKLEPGAAFIVQHPATTGLGWHRELSIPRNRNA